MTLKEFYGKTPSPWFYSLITGRVNVADDFVCTGNAPFTVETYDVFGVASYTKDQLAGEVYQRHAGYTGKSAKWKF